MTDARDRAPGDRSAPRYLRVSGVLAADNRLLLRPSYLTDHARGAKDLQDSPVQILLYAGRTLLLRWGAWVGTYGDADVRPPSERPRNDRTPEASFRPVRAKVPFPATTDRIVFRHGDVVVAEVRVPPHGPVIEEATVMRAGDGWRISWAASHPEKLRLFYHVRTTADRGRTWGRLGSRLTATELRVPLDALAGRDACIVQIVAYDGVNSTTWDVPVPDAPPAALQVRIVLPVARDEPYAPPIALDAIGRIQGRAGLLSHLADWTWFADGVEIATGPSAMWNDPAPGRHEIVLVARSERLEARAETTIRVAERIGPEPKGGGSQTA